MDKETILNRVKRLMALGDAKRNNSPEEAAAAAAKAQELLFKYNLEMADVDSIKDVPIEAINKTEYTVQANRNTFTWMSILFNQIAKSNFCRCICSNGTTRLNIIGKPSNAQVVIYLFEYLKREIEMLSHRAVIEQGIYGKKAVWVRSFCLGAVNSVSIMLKAKMAQNTAQSDKCTALVVVSDQQLETALKQFYPHIRSSRSTTIGNRGGYGYGQVAGRGININPGPGIGQGQRRQIAS